ncbi:MAG: tRNA-(ms[2]io[6]A)-hydroxylase [Proteobacteria bacterium]|nr:MAG: tRNA-(ms[2]io[6]A)-hydroxylase [Pseudomonadota bacterium]
MFKLRFKTGSEWTDAVLADFDRFLLDHASAEKKASGMAVSMISHYPDRPELVSQMAEVAVEEMVHFREVLKLILERGLVPVADTKDEYVNSLRKEIRKGTDVYMMDRLILGSVIEARGHERFGLVADALPPGRMKRFYQSITRSEDRHQFVFLDLALKYLPEDEVLERLDYLLDREAAIISEQAIAAALH